MFFEARSLAGLEFTNEVRLATGKQGIFPLLPPSAGIVNIPAHPAFFMWVLGKELCFIFPAIAQWLMFAGRSHRLAGEVAPRLPSCPGNPFVSDSPVYGPIPWSFVPLIKLSESSITAALTEPTGFHAFHDLSP